MIPIVSKALRVGLTGYYLGTASRPRCNRIEEQGRHANHHREFCTALKAPVMPTQACVCLL